MTQNNFSKYICKTMTTYMCCTMIILLVITISSGIMSTIVGSCYIKETGECIYGILDSKCKKLNNTFFLNQKICLDNRKYKNCLYSKCIFKTKTREDCDYNNGYWDYNNTIIIEKQK